ncbi:MAG: ImmA/IrrE family metallo-endopeptidase [Candidatus Saccharimonadota bacterium]
MSLFDDDIYGTNFEANLHFLNSNSPEFVFDTLGAHSWIKRNVVYKDGAVDIDGTSLNMGIPVHYSLTGLPDSEVFGLAATTGIINKNEPVEIFLSDTPHHLADRNASFGHELGHVFLDKMLGVCSIGNINEERFCDYVGLMIAIPDTEIEALGEISGASIMMLAEQLNVSHGTVIERLMRLEKLPPRVAYDITLSIDTDNPYYKGKVVRSVICLPCIDDYEHLPTEDLLSVPTFDLTTFDAHGTYNDSHRHGDSILQGELHRAVNLLHGRWTDDDEAYYNSEADRRRQ